MDKRISENVEWLESYLGFFAAGVVIIGLELVVTTDTEFFPLVFNRVFTYEYLM